MKALISRLYEEEKELILVREHLHKNPELSGMEIKTLEFIKESLSKIDIPFVEVKKGGIIATLSGGTGKETILLRADIDALPVKENPDNLSKKKSVVSTVDGVAHVCGHDAHTAMLLTAAKLLKEREKELNGKVLLCFERAEEGGGPDHSYGKDPLLKYLDENHIKPDKCIALHVNPELETGKISAEPMGVMAGSFGFEIHIKGSGGHGSRPDLANNPLDCFTAFYQSLSAMRIRKIEPYNLLTFSIPLVRMGTLGNVIEDDLYFEGTARALDTKSLEIFKESFVKQLDYFTEAFDCTYEVDLMYIEEPLCNDSEVAESIRHTVEELFGKEHYLACKANLGSESFAYYTQKYSGAMAFVGIKNEALGSGASLHSDRFDLDESALRYGAGALAGYALNELGNN